MKKIQGCVKVRHGESEVNLTKKLIYKDYKYTYIVKIVIFHEKIRIISYKIQESYRFGENVL